MCSVNNEAIFKPLFKVKDSELTFAKAILTAVEMEDAARVAKETVYGAKQTPVHKIQATKKKPSPANPNPSSKFVILRKRDFPKGTCPRCGKTEHTSKDCPFKTSTCHFCQKLGHIESACLQKRRGSQPVMNITKREIKMVNSINTVPQLEQQVSIQGRDFIFEVDTGAADNFCSHDIWVKLGKCPSSRPHVSMRWPMASLYTPWVPLKLSPHCREEIQRMKISPSLSQIHHDRPGCHCQAWCQRSSPSRCVGPFERQAR